MIDRVQRLAHSMRAVGVPVSAHEVSLAMATLAHVNLSDRAQVKSALATALCTERAHLEVLDLLFDLYFATVPYDSDPDASDEESVDPGFDEAAMFEELVEALAAADSQSLREMARRLLDAFAPSASGGFLLYKAERFIDPPRMARRLDELIESDVPSEVRRASGRRRMNAFRRILQEEVRSRMVLERSPDDVAERIRRLPVDARDFATITGDEAAEVRRAVTSLARRLAARLAKKRSKRDRGRLDVRRTIRGSMSAGGVPIDPRFRRPIISRPDLVLLCDVSGSVAAFTRFTLLLVAMLQSQFPRVRSFLFIDGLDEVTDALNTGDPQSSIPKALREADVIKLDGHSDYGSALTTFTRNHLDAITPKTHVLVLGDARNNFRDPAAESLKTIRERAKHTWWLNPEPKHHWDSGDSVMGIYAEHCDRVIECRNLRQLADFVETIVS